MASVTTLLILLMAATPTLAIDYIVGDSVGWSSGIDYTTWTADKIFKVNDTLLFQYNFLHGVSEVPESDYNACTTTNSIQTYNDQSTKITLTAPGNRYFVCGTPGHCENGMKLAVAVATETIPPTFPPSQVPLTTPAGPIEAPSGPAPQHEFINTSSSFNVPSANSHTGGTSSTSGFSAFCFSAVALGLVWGQ